MEPIPNPENSFGRWARSTEVDSTCTCQERDAGIKENFPPVNQPGSWRDWFETQWHSRRAMK